MPRNLKLLSPYEAGSMAAKEGAPRHSNPHGRERSGDREDRMDQEVSKRRWDAGWIGGPDPYPHGWAG